MDISDKTEEVSEDKETEENQGTEEESISDSEELSGESAEESGELSGLKSELDALKEESKENFDKYLRAVAELENFKKRNAKERADMLKYAGEHIARDLLDVIDDFDRAVSQENPGTVEEILEGVRLIRGSFAAVLRRHNVEGQDAMGEQFDPNTHEALTIVPTAEHPPGIVMEQLKKAYFFKDKLIRPAQVVVSTALEGASKDEEKEEEATDSDKND